MNLRVLPSIIIILFTLIVFSCKKDSTDSGGGTVRSPLEIRADSLYKYVSNQHFIPVDFYSSKPIDYNQRDSVIDSVTDLKPFILEYLSDDIIILKDDPDSTLDVNQGTKIYTPPLPEPPLATRFTTHWGISTSKALNVVYLKYLDYTYKEKRYTLDYFNDLVMLAHVPWMSEINSNDTATLYTRFRKQ